MHFKKKEREKKKSRKKTRVTHSYFPVGVEVHVFSIPAKIEGKCTCSSCFNHFVINKADSYILPTTRIQYAKDKSGAYLILS